MIRIVLHFEADTAGMLPFIHASPVSHLTGPVSPGRMRKWPSGMIANIILAMIAVPVSASETPLLPYRPTTVLLPGPPSGQSTNDSSTAYIFSPTDSGDSVALLSLDISSTVASASASSAVSTLTPSLPFLSSSSNTTTFIPTLASDGSIIVFAGDCSSESTSSVWMYNTTSSGQASWTHHQVTSADSTTGPQFLGGAIAFSETISPSVSAPQIYSYGGQCPNSTVNGTTWIDAADYSGSMTQLTPSTSAYEASILSLKTQPIAEAGFTLTQLLPSTSNISGTVTQNINSVVLGGHTRGAFVNISTAAVWALPEASWSFVSISGPSSSASSATNELAKNDREAVQVQPRSGHTAVLNEAGSKLVILGGWVGDTSQAAEPQLAILEMDGNEFGDWTWSVPNEQPLTDGNGIFGHGAALLPGNIMMVAGGNAISSSSSSSNSRLHKRDGISVAGGQLQMFLNLTSLTWTDTYTNPLTTSSNPQSKDTSSSKATRLGLGLGLGLGIPLLLAALALVFFCIRRSRRHRHHTRDDHIRDLTSGAAFITSEEMLEAEHEREYRWGPRGAAQWYGYYTGGHDPYLRGEKFESLRSQHGDLDADLSDSELPAGYQGSSRSKPVPRIAKGLYQPTGVDESRALAVISPILEDEEDELSMHGAISPDKEMEGNEDDPFVTPMESTPLRGNYPEPGERSTILFVAPSPSPGPPTPTTEPHTPTRVQPQHPEVQDWVLDVDASDALITQRLQPNFTSVRNIGRVSPTRRHSVRFTEGEISPGTRTESNISESNRSAFSFMPFRSDSLRVAALTVGMADNRGGTSYSDKSSSSNTNSSYMTAKSIPTLQQEGPTLLLGRPRAISAIENVADDWDDDPLSPGSPSKSKPPRRSWFGSLRRVFSGGHSSGSSNGASSLRTESPAHGDSSDYDRLGLSGLGLGGVGAGMLQKRKQGRSAWDGAGAAEASASGHGHGAGEGWDEEDWDIEKAVEQRLVQVMFSVPKERLRVVNGEPDIISIEESVVVVDPESEADEAQEDLPSILEENRLLPRRKDMVEGKQASAGADYQLPQTVDNEQRRIDGEDEGETAPREKGKQRESVNIGSRDERIIQSERRPLLLEVPQPAEIGSEESETPRRSFSPGVPMTAEEVRYEKPRTPPRTRTKVQEMIEDLEQRSRSNSPTKDRLSPSRAS